MRFLIAHSPARRGGSPDRFVHAVGSMGWKAACGAPVETYEEKPFTHLNARACPKCVKAVAEKGGLK